MCEPGYFETTIVDDARNSTSKVCLAKFCGINGYGDTCQNFPSDTTLKNCRRAKRIQLTKKLSVDSCSQCEPGYYAYSFTLKDLATGGLAWVQNCKK